MEVREHTLSTPKTISIRIETLHRQRVQVFFKDGTSTDRIGVDFPIGHRERRKEGIPALKQKFVDSVSSKLADRQWAELDAYVRGPGETCGHGRG